MKTRGLPKLFYNPEEAPKKIQFFKDGTVITLSEDNYFQCPEAPSLPAHLDSLFKVIEDFDDIIVVLTAHNEAYYWSKGEHEDERTSVVGEISLKAFRNGGGYLKDNHISIKRDRT